MRVFTDSSIMNLFKILFQTGSVAICISIRMAHLLKVWNPFFYIPTPMMGSTQRPQVALSASSRVSTAQSMAVSHLYSSHGVSVNVVHTQSKNTQQFVNMPSMGQLLAQLNSIHTPQNIPSINQLIKNKQSR